MHAIWMKIESPDNRASKSNSSIKCQLVQKLNPSKAAYNNNFIVSCKSSSQKFSGYFLGVISWKTGTSVPFPYYDDDWSAFPLSSYDACVLSRVLHFHWFQETWEGTSSCVDVSFCFHVSSPVQSRHSRILRRPKSWKTNSRNSTSLWNCPKIFHCVWTGQLCRLSRQLPEIWTGNTYRI